MNSNRSKESIALEIIQSYSAGGNLNYSHMTNTNMPLLRAAIRIFGTWAAAVNFAGLDYDSIRLYKAWTRERIIERIRELHARGEDLSWRNVSTNVDPQLAAAATKKNHFGSWREALESSGLDYDSIRRYREWDDDRVIRMVQEFHNQGAELNAKTMVSEDVRLITAARRRFESWPEALTAAGIDFRNVVQRAPFKRGLGRGQSAARSGVRHRGHSVQPAVGIEERSIPATG